MGKFGGKLVLVLLDSKHRPPIRDGRSLWALQSDLTYNTKADPLDIITVPRGFVTDLTSVPRVFWSFLPPDGPWVKAAVVHDFLYYTQGDGVWYKRTGISRRERYSRRAADDILREGMADRDIDAWAQFIIWAAVRVGGWIAWQRKHTKLRAKPTAAELAPSKAGAKAPA